MSDRFLCTCVLACVSMAAAQQALAGGPPWAGNSTVPYAIELVGCALAVPDSSTGQFGVIPRNLANDVERGCRITVDFSTCSGVRVACGSLGSGATVDAAAERVSVYSDQTGLARFTIAGASSPAGAVADAGLARIYGDGALLGAVPVHVYDLDGVDGVNANDLSIWLGDFASGEPRLRSDYDSSGDLGANDLSRWLEVFGSGRSAESGLALTP